MLINSIFKDDLHLTYFKQFTLDYILIIYMKKLSKYPPIMFHSKDVSEAFHIASNTKFASIILTQQPQIDILFAPFYTLFNSTKQTTFYSHLLRSNPIYAILQEKKSIQCKLVFQQCDMYISPTAYAEKSKSHQVVPTWNYVAAQFRGQLEMVQHEQLKSLLSKEVEIFQESVDSKWRLSDAPDDYIEGLMKSIFGIKLNVKDWKVHKKLSQNKSKDQYPNVKKWCSELIKKQKNIVDWMQDYAPDKIETK